MRYRGVLFDLDGTMVDNMPVHLATWIELLRDMGVRITTEEFHHRYAGKTNPVIFRDIFGERFSDAEIRRMAAHKEALYRERFAADLHPVPGLPELLDALDARGIPAAVASSGPSINVGFVLDGLGWRKRFGAVITGDDITHCKPHPEAFLTAADRLGVAARDCLVFEDAPVGIEAAHRAGMDTIALTTTLPPGELAGRPSVVAVCPDFHAAAAWLSLLPR